jgi:hypothetical protein
LAGPAAAAAPFLAVKNCAAGSVCAPVHSPSQQFLCRIDSFKFCEEGYDLELRSLFILNDLLFSWQAQNSGLEIAEAYSSLSPG